MKKICDFCSKFKKPDIAILLIRIAIGAVFVNAGWMKVTNVEMVIGGFASMGFPAALAYFVSYAELIAGALIILGVATRGMSVILAIIMAVATFKVHFAAGYSLANGGYEYTLTLMLTLIGIALFGAGKYAVEYCLCNRHTCDADCDCGHDTPKTV
jgi:putative oxidoreductase